MLLSNIFVIIIPSAIACNIFLGFNWFDVHFFSDNISILKEQFSPIITNLARAFRWQALIDSGKFSNVHELARAIGKDDGYVSRIIRLTLFSPEIIHAIIAGTLEKDIGIEQLKQAIPLMWDEQKKMFGME